MPFTAGNPQVSAVRADVLDGQPGESSDAQ
jgi:hypothetical protein